jgi:hypothetical protein
MCCTGIERAFVSNTSRFCPSFDRKPVHAQVVVVSNDLEIVDSCLRPTLSIFPMTSRMLLIELKLMEQRDRRVLRRSNHANGALEAPLGLFAANPDVLRQLRW